jgi:peptidoglycan/xylan/chitin deacetylase (PgdA/CDA1 family)
VPPTLTTSWDDGTPEDVELGRLLAHYGFKGTFYATTGPTGERTIDDDGLRALLAWGHELGNHGRSHTPFPELDERSLREEVLWGESQLAAFGVPVRVIAPPRGISSQRVVDRLVSWGYAVRMAPILGGSRRRPHVIVPTVHLYPHGFGQMTRNLARQMSPPSASVLRAWITARTPAARVRNLLHAAARTDGLLHIWGHAADLERFGLWRDFESLLEEAAELSFVAAVNSEVVVP